jgi:DNA processing protein
LELSINDKNYPEILKGIKKPPQKLYYKGNLKLLKEPALAVIGSRHLTDYGRNVERKFVRDLALRDIVIVSGLAQGADRVAHEETLNAHGKTIAVMGTGFNHIFPEENKDIYERILKEDGLIITEYEDDVDFESKNFPMRNRIISGLSKGLLVVEAAIISGTSITAGYAWEQGRKVFAIPGRLDSKNGVGVNRLIQKGAKLVVGAHDITDEFDEFRNRIKRNISYTPVVKKEYRKIYEVLSDLPISVEEISLKTQNNVRCTMNLLTMMELEDLIEQVVGVRIHQKI